MNKHDLIGMAWADRISFEEIKKKNWSFGKRSDCYHEKEA